jgi:hypothetical protein
MLHYYMSEAFLGCPDIINFVWELESQSDDTKVIEFWVILFLGWIVV